MKQLMKNRSVSTQAVSLNKDLKAMSEGYIALLLFFFLPATAVLGYHGFTPLSTTIVLK